MSRLQYGKHLLGSRRVTVSALLLLTNAGLAIAAASAPAIPFKEGAGLSADFLMRIAGVSLFAILLVVVAVILIKRLMLHRGVLLATTGRRVALIESQRMGVRTTVSLIRIDAQEYLVAQCGDQLQLLKHHAASQAERSSNDI